MIAVPSGLRERSDFAAELREKSMHERDAFSGQRAGSSRMQHARQLQQLCVEVIDCVVRGLSVFTERVVTRVKFVTESAGGRKAARDANCAERIEPIGVLQDLGFARGREDASRKRVDGDGVANLIGTLGIDLARKELVPRMLGAHFTRVRRIGMILGVAKELVEQGGGHTNIRIRLLCLCNRARTTRYAPHVGHIVRGIFATTGGSKCIERSKVERDGHGERRSAALLRNERRDLGLVEHLATHHHG